MNRAGVTIGLMMLASLFGGVGCGTVVQRSGTDQLLLSDAVDRSIDMLDFSPLAGRRVFLDTSYMPALKSPTFVNAEYITSALRQKMTTSGCLIQDSRQEADYVLEPRVGALGSDSMEVTYGIPSSNGVSQAATLISGTPAVPAIPEISFGKRKGGIGVAKLMVFAYHKETGTPVWQSGNAIARSDAKDSWFLGMGPITRGSVYDGTRIAGHRLSIPFLGNRPKARDGELTIADRHQFVHPAVLERQLADSEAAESDAGTEVLPAAHASDKDEQ